MNTPEIKIDKNAIDAYIEQKLEKVIERVLEKEVEKVIKKVLEKEEVKCLVTSYRYAKDQDVDSKNSLLSIDNDTLESGSLYFTDDIIPIEWDISCNYNVFNSCPPLIKTSDFVIRDMECYFIVNNRDGPTYLILPNASDYPHYWNRKEIILKNLQEQPIFSKEDNIRQLDSKKISNCILSANNKGKYVSLMTNGKTWYIKSIF
jgi:hypothetical protein